MRSFATTAIMAVSVFAANDSNFAGPEIAQLSTSGRVSWETITYTDADEVEIINVALYVSATMTTKPGQDWAANQETYICMPSPEVAETESCILFDFFHFGDALSSLKYSRWIHPITEDSASWVANPPTYKYSEYFLANGGSLDAADGRIDFATVDGVITKENPTNNGASLILDQSSHTETSVTGTVRFFITNEELKSKWMTCGDKLPSAMSVWQSPAAAVEPAEEGDAAEEPAEEGDATEEAAEEAAPAAVVENQKSMAVILQIVPMPDADQSACGDDTPAKNPEPDVTGGEVEKAGTGEEEDSSTYLAASLAALAMSALAF